MPSNKPESRLIRAAGAVAWRPGLDGELEILLVHRQRYDDWSLPKGKTEPGEPLPVTAVREVLEEGGARLALGRRLVSARYNVGGRPKRVHYWAARVISTDDHAVPNSEVDLIDWVPVKRAVERVSYAHDHGILADFARLPAHTVPLIFLRHARAVGKSDWKRGDVRRPLDDSGRADAKSLADLLACFAPRAGFAPGAGFALRPRLISSPAARCLETLRPFAEQAGAPVREEPSLYIHHPSSGTGRADSVPSIADLVTEAIAAGEPTVFCAHRENISHLQAAALAALRGVPVPGDVVLGDAPPAGALLAEPAPADDGLVSPQLPKEWNDPLPTAGFWVLNFIPAPPPPASSPAPSSPAAAAPAPQASTAAAPWRWLRARGRISRKPIVDALVSEVGTDVVAPGGTAGGAPRPAARLISADRYDLSDT